MRLNKTYFLIKLMTLYNFMNDSYKLIRDRILSFYGHIRDYFTGIHETWLFIPGHTLPLSLSKLYNSCHVKWIYDNNNYTLNIVDDFEEKNVVAFSWLSAKICISNQHHNNKSTIEYDIDNFLSNFKLSTIYNITPDLNTIYLCWCIYSKHWFRKDAKIEFIVIDENGDTLRLDTKDESVCLVIKDYKVSISIE